jgi:hypothetical protein
MPVLSLGLGVDAMTDLDEQAIDAAAKAVNDDVWNRTDDREKTPGPFQVCSWEEQPQKIKDEYRHEVDVAVAAYLAARGQDGSELDRLRKGMAERGFIVGRNLDGVDDSVGATLLAIDELLAARGVSYETFAEMEGLRYQMRRATEELDRAGVEKYDDRERESTDDREGAEWSVQKRIALLASRGSSTPEQRRPADRTDDSYEFDAPSESGAYRNGFLAGRASVSTAIAAYCEAEPASAPAGPTEQWLAGKRIGEGNIAWVRAELERAVLALRSINGVLDAAGKRTEIRRILAAALAESPVAAERTDAQRVEFLAALMCFAQSNEDRTMTKLRWTDNEEADDFIEIARKTLDGTPDYATALAALRESLSASPVAVERTEGKADADD